MASPSENAATTRKHVEPLLMVALTLSFFSCVAAFISQFLLPSSDLTCSSRNVVSYCLVLYGLALVLFWGLFLAAITELQAAKNFLKALLTEIGLLQLAFIVIYVTLLFSGRPLGSSECPFANYIFSRSLILQILSFGSFGLLLCIASTYRDILGEFGAEAVDEVEDEEEEDEEVDEEEEGNYIIIFNKFSFAKSHTQTFSVL